MWKGQKVASTDNPVLRHSDLLHDSELASSDSAVQEGHRAGVVMLATAIGPVRVSTHVVDQLRTRLDSDLMYSLPGNTFFERTVGWMRACLEQAVPAGLRDIHQENKKVLRYGRRATYLIALGWIFVVVQDNGGAGALVTAYAKEESEIARLYHLRPDAQTPPAVPALSVVPQEPTVLPEISSAPVVSAEAVPADLPALPTPALPHESAVTESQVDLNICTDAGQIRVAIDFNEDEAAKGIMRQILFFLKIRSVNWKGIEYTGGPQTQPRFISLKLHQQRLRVRVGRYVGTLQDAIHQDGHKMDHREIFAGWNLSEYKVDKAGAAPSNRGATASTGDDLLDFCANHDQMAELLRLCYEGREKGDTVGVHHVGTILRQMGVNVRQGTVKTVLDRQQSLGWLTLLDEDSKLYGFDNAGLEVLGIDPMETAAPLPPEPVKSAAPVEITLLAAASEPVAPQIIPVQPPPPAVVAAAPTPPVVPLPVLLAPAVPEVNGELQTLLFDIGAKLNQRDAAIRRKAQLMSDLAANEEARLRLSEEQTALFTQMEQADAEIKRLDAVQKALEALRSASMAA